MNAEFNWWLLIVGLVVGAGLVWFVVADARRRESEIDADERPREALWLSAVLAEEGHDVSPAAAERLLELHSSYLDAPPPDGPSRSDLSEIDEPLRHDPDTRTGSGPTTSPAASTSETPKVGPPSSPATAGDGPTQ